MRLPFCSLLFARSLCGGCALLFLVSSAARAQGEWQLQASFGPNQPHQHFSYRSAVPPGLYGHLDLSVAGSLRLTRQLTERLRLGLEQRMASQNLHLRYRSRAPLPTGRTTAGYYSGALHQTGLSLDWLLIGDPRWELTGSLNASAGIGASRFSNWQEEVWHTDYTAGGQSLTLRGRRLRRVGVLAGAELRLIYWVGDGPHGLLVSLGHQQGLLPLLAFESREFSYPVPGGGRQSGGFEVRSNGSYGLLQLGYCIAFGRRRAAPTPRWHTPRYSLPPAQPDEQEASGFEEETD